MEAVSAEEVDEYLRRVEEPKRGTLQALRRTILEIVPDAEEVISAACALAFESDQQIAVLISQRMLGRKKWTETK